MATKTAPKTTKKAPVPAPEPEVEEVAEPEEVPDLQFGAATLKVRGEYVDPGNPFGLREEDRMYIPPFDEGYELEDEALEALALCVEMRQPALLVGPTGCGKSSLIEALASILDQPCRRVNLHGDVRAADFVGEKTLELDDAGNPHTIWRDGVLPDSMRKGHWIILDEFDATPASIAMVAQAALEQTRKLVLSSNHGEVIEAHPDWRIFATANTLGRGDESGLYAGTNLMNEATLDRFVVLQRDYLPAEKEIAVVSGKTGVAPEIASKMIEVARLIRQGFGKSECFSTFSTRRLLAWGQLQARFAITLAPNAATRKSYAMAVGHKLGTEDARYFAGVVQRVMAIDVTKKS